MIIVDKIQYVDNRITFKICNIFINIVGYTFIRNMNHQTKQIFFKFLMKNIIFY